ncbi:MAG: hypothetical protein A2992_08860 [Elusimicrobia bacterium RIFCSPLOWO2_01_FULL_59_12]|nr:MAG: hypothetical protein A2992_08860 [Elusimicrobia bacterium RIFCSPLOWO2_01_FULL_59_12]
MTVHELFAREHAQLRQGITEILRTLTENPQGLEGVFLKFQHDARAHFRKEDEVYYPYVDSGKKIGDRELMHTLRNDHAAVIFALESLAIRLRKKSPPAEWKVKFETMTSVLLPHFDHEEQKLYPEVERVLLPADHQKLLEQIQALP